MTAHFAYLFIFSSVFGFLGGILCALFLKKMKFINMSRIHEVCVLIFFAFITYTFAQEIGLSPIMALLFAGIALSQYAYYNVSFQAREESCIVAKIMSNIAEAFVYTYLGLTFLSTVKKQFCLSFIIWEALFIIIARWLTVHCLVYLFRDMLEFKNFKMKNTDSLVLSFCGSVRGSISFGLAVSIDTANREIIISGTLVLIFLSNIFFGGIQPRFFRAIKMLQDTEKSQKIGSNSDNVENPVLPSTKEFSFKFISPNVPKEETGFRKETDDERRQRLSYKIGELWGRINEGFIKPKVINDYPNSIDEDEELTKGIKFLMESRSILKKKSSGNIEPTMKRSSKTVDMDKMPMQVEETSGNNSPVGKKVYFQQN